jgi:hypothetical protein
VEALQTVKLAGAAATAAFLVTAEFTNLQKLEEARVPSSDFIIGSAVEAR